MKFLFRHRQYREYIALRDQVEKDLWAKVESLDYESEGVRVNEELGTVLLWYITRSRFTGYQITYQIVDEAGCCYMAVVHNMAPRAILNCGNRES